MPEKLWMEVCDIVHEVVKTTVQNHCTGGSDQNHPQEKEMQKGKMAV